MLMAIIVGSVNTVLSEHLTEDAIRSFQRDMTIRLSKRYHVRTYTSMSVEDNALNIAIFNLFDGTGDMQLLVRARVATNGFRSDGLTMERFGVAKDWD